MTTLLDIAPFLSGALVQLVGSIVQWYVAKNLFEYVRQARTIRGTATPLPARLNEGPAVQRFNRDVDAVLAGGSFASMILPIMLIMKENNSFSIILLLALVYPLVVVIKVLGTDPGKYDRWSLGKLFSPVSISLYLMCAIGIAVTLVTNQG